jgi:hypothetical protein
MNRIDKITTAVVVVFFLLSLFYFVYNIFLSPQNSTQKIFYYLKSLNYLDKLLAVEKKRNEQLKEEYEFITYHPSLSIEAFDRDYLFLIPKDTWIMFKGNRTDEVDNSTVGPLGP